jgi:hypothetical protein
VDHSEIGALDHVRFGLRTERPGEADLVTVSIRNAVERESEAWKASLDGADQSPDLIMAFSGSERIDVSRGRGPALSEQSAAAMLIGLIPGGNVAVSDLCVVSHCDSPSVALIDQAR